MVELTCFENDWAYWYLGLCLKEQEHYGEFCEIEDIDLDYKQTYSGFIECSGIDRNPIKSRIFSSIDEKNLKQLIEILDSRGDYYSEKIRFSPNSIYPQSIYLDHESSLSI